MGSLLRDMHVLKRLAEDARLGRQIEVVGKMLSMVGSKQDRLGGQVLVSGVGKSGLVARRFSASLRSISKRSMFIQAAEWGHGDLGQCWDGEGVVVFLSNSGTTTECVEACKMLRDHPAGRNYDLVGVFASRNGEEIDYYAGREHLSEFCSFQVEYPYVQDLLNGWMPTSSIIAQEAVLNAILCSVVENTRFTAPQFKINHPK